MSLSGRVALVTGGGRGIGRAVAVRLAREGSRVVVAGRTESEIEEVAGAIGGVAVAMDVADRASLQSGLAAIAERAGRIDVLVNNAGIALDGINADVARRTLDVNFFGAMRATDALLPRIPSGGNIVMVSSGMGESSCLAPPLRKRILAPDLTRDQLALLMESFVRDVERGRHTEAGWPSSAYRVSKVGLNALTRILARELSGRSIRVNAVCPGWVRTDMGGAGASRPVDEGAASIVWAATTEDAPTGGFFRDGRAIPW
jgi:carbonyl reductase 1